MINIKQTFVWNVLRKIKFFVLDKEYIQVCIYLYEMLTSIFDNSIRICFTNFSSGFKRTLNNNSINRFYDSTYRFDNSNRICSLDFNRKGYSFNEINSYYYAIKNNYLNNNSKFKIVKYYKPNIHYFSVFGDVNKLYKSKSKIKILINFENTTRGKYIDYNKNFDDIIDLKLGYIQPNETNSIRLPNWIAWYFPIDSSKDDIKNILDNYTRKNNKKIKFSCLLSKHDGNGLKTKIYNELSTIDKVDCPGKFLHNDDSLLNKYYDNKLLYMDEYKFNICPENSYFEGYSSEKIIECLFSGCIPIYNAYSKDPEPGIVNPDIILWYDEHDEENNRATVNEVRKLHENELLYKSFLQKPFFCDTAVDKIYDMLNHINTKMQEILSTKLIP